MGLNIFYVFLGGGIGSVIRYLFIYFMKVQFWGTFLVNILGCLIVGLVFGFLQTTKSNVSFLNYFLIIGFCGGFTTFSSFSLDQSKLYQNSSIEMMLIYTISSVVLGYIMVYLGIRFGQNSF